MKRFLIPLAVFLALVGFLAVGLQRDPRAVPSPFIGKPAPAFSVPQLDNPGATGSPAHMRGKVWLLNVWASWCAACQAEHPVLLEFKRSSGVPIVGLNYKDMRPEATAWLARHGNPYTWSAFDHDGRAGLDYGVYGVPETFLIDQHGIIRFKHVGPLTRQILEQQVLPMIAGLERG